MNKRFDVWMCTYNSEKLLPMTLKRISEVIPPTAINRKFIVDDFSTDNSTKVAKELGWEVYANKKKGLYNAMQYAFSLVETDYCASFEHDIYLAENWFPRIPKWVTEQGYGIAQGIRVRDARGFKEIDIYDNNHRTISSEDNTFYAMIPPEIRDILTGKTDKDPSQLKRYVDKIVCSRHIRGNAKTCLKHGYYIYRQVNTVKISAHVKCLAKSPILALKVAKETRGYSVLIFYPLERVMILSGALASKLF